MESASSLLGRADLARITSPVDAVLSENPLSAGSAEPVSGFAGSLMQAIASVDDKDRIAAERMAEVEKGSSDDLVGAMLASQDASLSFSMLMQVRNKVMGAVDELIKLQL